MAGEPLLVDPERNVFIPGTDLEHGTLRVAATYDNDQFRIHNEYATDDPSWSTSTGSTRAMASGSATAAVLAPTSTAPGGFA